MSNLKLVAGTVKRRGIAIAAAVAVAGGSLATANYAMAVEANEPTQQELEAEFLGTEVGNIAAETADEYNKALKSGATEDQLRQILENGLKSAAQADDAGFTAEDLAAYDKNKLNNELQGIVDSTKQSQEKEIPAQPENPAAKWATPAPEGKYSPQRLEAEFGGTEEGKAAEETARIVADALRRGTPEAQVRELIKERLLAAGFPEDQIGKISDNELNGVFQQAKKKAGQDILDLNEDRQEALVKLQLLEKLNPLQRSIFEGQIKAAVTKDEINKVFNAATAENANPVQQFAPVPGQNAPEKAGEQTDVEKALAHTKQEALKKLEGFTFLTDQQKEAYKKQVEAATQVIEVEETFESGEAKNTANKAAKEATNFVGKALARTKQLALKQLDGMTGLNHEQKKEARNKILAAKQVFEVEAAFHAAEKLNKAAK